VLRHSEALAARVQAWPCEAVDEDAVAAVLKKERRTLREALEAGVGHYARETRHDLRRKLRRYANLRRLASQVLEREDGEVPRLLALAKRCGHEGDLWMAARSARRAGRADPELLDLALDLEAHRRRMSKHHDASLLRLDVGQ